MLVHKTIVRVRYADTDQMGFVYNGKYFEYFEVGRTEMMRSVGLPYNSIEAGGIQMPVRETGIKYKNAALYDEELEIETRVPRLPDPKVHIEHTIRSVQRGLIIAEGFVDLMFIKADTKRACRPPEFFINAIRHFYE
jgi:acyl-CoA thioester hydrolase